MWLPLFARADSWRANHSSGPNLPSDIEPPTPPQEQLAAAYQPSAYDPNDHTVLRRLRYSPDPAIWGPGPYPTVLTIHVGGFRNYDDHGTPHQRLANKDLSDAGFLVFSIEYRLAPDGLLLGQHQHDNTALGIASGRPPQQSNDVKQQILAARGSSAAFPKAVVGLSGIYDLPLRTPPPPQQFINDVDNYTNTIDNFIGLEYQYSTSPISYVYMATNQTAPARLYATDGDSVPHQQAEEMRDALQPKGVDVLEYTLSGTPHAFAYWHTINNITGICVSTEVIAFLNAHR